MNEQDTPIRPVGGANSATAADEVVAALACLGPSSPSVVARHLRAPTIAVYKAGHTAIRQGRVVTPKYGLWALPREPLRKPEPSTRFLQVRLPDAMSGPALCPSGKTRTLVLTTSRMRKQIRIQKGIKRGADVEHPVRQM